MKQDFLFSTELAEDIASYSSYNKGEEYYRDGNVGRRWQEGDVFKAIVQGATPYTVTITPHGEKVETSCTCPYELEGACKHVVAAILAFTEDRKSRPSPAEEKVEKVDRKVKALVAKAPTAKINRFLEEKLRKDADLRKDLEIYLSGKKETPATIEDYKEHFREELDELDLKDLIEAWYYSGEDCYYDNSGAFFDNNYDEETIADLVDSFLEEAKKYTANGNTGEGLKIVQAIFLAIEEKENSLQGEEKEISVWFSNAAENVIRYFTDLALSVSLDKRQEAVIYLCHLFENKSSLISQKNLSEVIVRVASDRSLGLTALENLKSTVSKENLTSDESFLITRLYKLTDNDLLFEEISQKYLTKNPKLALNLIRFYHKTNQKSKLIIAAQTALTALSESVENKFLDNFYDLTNDGGWPLDRKNTEIELRRELTTCLSLDDDYLLAKDNLERTFLLTGELSDYKNAASVYKTTEEKETFLKKMEIFFTKSQEIRSLFKVFRLENRSEKILQLIREFREEDFYPEMICSISKLFPNECFAEYVGKIKRLLEVTDVRLYPQVAYHLKRMREIEGKGAELLKFVEWIKVTYFRRRRLMEELKEKHF